ncbi:hypothetical protein [Marinomonas sp. IMCC 4694]|uniref:hypothetical protein n=1 Tax=Marinomonas sp. IMCC 4694 TaxID=2605432 RepID=UPI00165326AC|nr:hypothetical protein [Marinomonas sp. IMCC 4694]
MVRRQEQWGVVCVLACCSLPVLAAPDTVSAQGLREEQRDLITDDASWWLTSHEDMSKTIGSWATNIDVFLSGESSSPPPERYLNSRFNVRFGSVLGDGARASFFDFNAQLKLPNTQDRLRLVIESEASSLAPESLQGESQQQQGVVDSALQSSITTAVRYIKEDLGLDVDAGVRVNFPLDPFLRLRFKQEEEQGPWHWRQNQEVFAYYSKGVGARYGVGLSYTARPNLNYSTDFGVTWLDKEGLFYGRENLIIQHRLDDKNRLAYQLSFLQSGAYSLEPDSFLYNIQYERLLYKKWLIGQVKPQYTHDAEDDYAGKFSLTLSLVILLGPEYVN